LVDALGELKRYSIYLLESYGPLYDVLREVPLFSCSEYFEDIESGLFKNGIRSEDVQNLSYIDESFDFVISQDVFEHVPNYEKGFQDVLTSDVNHDYLRFGVRQNFKIGTMGTTSYHATSGKFLNSINLREFDFKFHRRSDPIWFSNPLYSFQDLDTSLPTLDWYFEAHIIHHFNGALINKIPFMKKTRLMTVAGGGYLYVPEHNWQHYEIFAGVERIFKFSRRRLRVGTYGVFSDGNQTPARTTGKISFALLNRRNMKFNF